MIRIEEFIINNIFTILRFILVMFFLFIIILKRETLFSQGYKFIRLKEYEKALEEFNEALEKKPKKENSLFGIAHCYYMLGLNAHAIKYYEKVIEINPNWGEVYFLLALLYMEEKKDFNKAIEYLEKGAKNQNKKYFINRASKFQINEIKGWIFYLRGDIESAVKSYDLAIPLWNKYLKKILKSFNERFAPVCFRLGVIYKLKGEIEKAKEKFKQSIKASPPSIFAKRSQEELKELEKVERSIPFKDMM